MVGGRSRLCLMIWVVIVSAAKTRAGGFVGGMPEDDGTVRFRLERGNSLYRQLVSTPGLSGIATVDRASGKILGVGFRGRCGLGR